MKAIFFLFHPSCTSISGHAKALLSGHKCCPLMGALNSADLQGKKKKKKTVPALSHQQEPKEISAF